MHFTTEHYPTHSETDTTLSALNHLQVMYELRLSPQVSLDRWLASMASLDNSIMCLK